MKVQNVSGVTEQMKHRDIVSSPAPPHKTYLYTFFVYSNISDMPRDPHLTGDTRIIVLSPALKIFTHFHPHSA